MPAARCSRVTLFTQTLRVLFQERSYRPPAPFLDRLGVSKKTFKCCLHQVMIAGDRTKPIGLCRVAHYESRRNRAASTPTRHNPELGIIPEPVYGLRHHCCGRWCRRNTRGIRIPKQHNPESLSLNRNRIGRAIQPVSNAYEDAAQTTGGRKKPRR